MEEVETPVAACKPYCSTQTPICSTQKLGQRHCAHSSSCSPVPGPAGTPGCVAAGLQLDPANEQMKQGLQDAKAAAANVARGPAGPMGGLFTQPEVLSRLATNPQVKFSPSPLDFNHAAAQLCGLRCYLTLRF